MGPNFSQQVQLLVWSDVTLSGPQWIVEDTAIAWWHVLQLWKSQNGNHHGRSQAENEVKEKQKLKQQTEGVCTLQEQLPLMAAA